MSLVVRTPTPSDATRIAELHVATWKEAYAHLLPDDFFDVAHTRMRQRMWDQILNAPRDEWIVRIAEVDGRAVGFAMSGPSFGAEGQDLPRERHVYNIYVVESEHGTGVGQSLLDEIVGTDPAMLWVAKENPRAIAFYRRNGFELDGAEQVDSGDSGITSVRMVR